MNLTSKLIAAVVDEVLKSVDEVKEVYENASPEEKQRIYLEIWKDFVDECNCAEDVLDAEFYIDNKDNTIGWDWITEEE